MTRFAAWGPVLAVTTLAAPSPARGQEAPNAVRSLVVLSIDDAAVELDGVLGEPSWAQASFADEFTQRDPVDGAPSTERTEVRVLRSASAIYVGVRAFDSDPGGIVGRLARRDEIEGTDAVTIYLDSFHDRRTAFHFTVTPRGSIGDIYSTNDNPFGDDSWDPVWEVATSVDASGWAAEFRIPFTQLRFATDESTWGFQVRRQIQRKSEDAYWAPFSKSASGFASLFGELRGLSDLPSPARLEVRPYVVAEGRNRPASTGSTYAPTRSTGANAGFDLKYGLTSDFTLDVAANPDFGQVEADPAVVNLTAFESFFPERRPFFVEGSSLFNHSVPGGNLFYSRRIGRGPQGAATAPTGGTVEAPDASTIVTAAKITGKTAAGLGLGIMSAFTAEERGTLRDGTGSVVGTARVQPRVHHFAGRVERDFSEGQHTVGTMVTALNRLGGATSLGLREAAYSTIVDGSHRWARNTYNFSWSFGASHVRGAESVIVAAQRSSSRYFQRPDADHVHVDSARTSLDGYALSLNAGKNAGTWRYYGWVDRRSPGLELSDMGFLFGPVDRQSTGTGLGYVRSQPAGPFRNFEIFTAETRFAWTTDWERVETWMRPLFFGGNLRNNWYFNINPIAFDFGERSIEALRGGPSLRQNTWHQSFVNLSTDGRRRLSFNMGATIGGRFGTEAKWTYGYIGTTLRPNSTVRARLDLNYSWEKNPEQWVGRQTIQGTTRYVLATVRHQTLDARARLDWTLSPRLSFQLFAQPFTSAGKYSAYLEVLDPRAAEWADRFYAYGDAIACGSTTCAIDRDQDGNVDASFDRPDFDVESLRMTSVLRWEYLPGSVLYVAWQHGRSDSGTEGSFAGMRAVPDLLRLPSDNTVVVKVSHWLGL